MSSTSSVFFSWSCWLKRLLKTWQWSQEQSKQASLEDVTSGLERTKDKANDTKLEPESDGKVDTDNKYKEKTSKKLYMSYFAAFKRAGENKVPAVQDMSNDQNNDWMDECKELMF